MSILYDKETKLMDKQLFIAIGTLAVSAGIAWGVASAKLKALEIRLAIVKNEPKSDHDLLIEIRTKLDMLLQQLVPLYRGVSS
jgi:hypothetical protein